MADLRPLVAIIVVTGVIAFWRGLWGFMDIYLFPDNLILSYEASILIGLVILGVTNYLVKEFM